MPCDRSPASQLQTITSGASQKTDFNHGKFYVHTERHREGDCYLYNITSFRDAQWLPETGFCKTIFTSRHSLSGGDLFWKCVGGNCSKDLTLVFQNISELWLCFSQFWQCRFLSSIKFQRKKQLLLACMVGDRLTVLQLAKLLCERYIVIYKQLKLYAIYIQFKLRASFSSNANVFLGSNS